MANRRKFSRGERQEPLRKPRLSQGFELVSPGNPWPAWKSHIKVFDFILPAINSLLSTSLSGGWWVYSLLNKSDHRSLLPGTHLQASLSFTPRGEKKEPKSPKKFRNSKCSLKKSYFFLENNATLVCFHWPKSLENVYSKKMSL